MNCVDMGWRRMPRPAPIAVSDLSSSPSRKPSRKSQSDFPLTQVACEKLGSPLLCVKVPILLNQI